jgi:hypothetical protein
MLLFFNLLVNIILICSLQIGTGLQDWNTKWALYVQLNNEEHSRYHGCRGKAICITYSE